MKMRSTFSRFLCERDADAWRITVALQSTGGVGGNANGKNCYKGTYDT